MVPSKIHPFKKTFYSDFTTSLSLKSCRKLCSHYQTYLENSIFIPGKLTSTGDESVPGKSSISVEESAPQLRRLIRQSNTSARARSQIFRRWTSWTWGLSDKVIEVEKLYMVVNCRRWLSWTWWSSWTRWLGWTRCLTKCCTLRLIKWVWRWWRRGQRESDWQWAVILGLVILEEVPHIHNPGPFQLLKY